MDLFDRLRAQERGENGEKETSLALVGTGPEENALWKDGRLRWGRLFHVVRFVPTALLLLPLVPFTKKSVPSFSDRLPAGSTRAVSLIGCVLIVANVLCGAAKINSYPFSVYPTFAVRADSTTTTLQVEGIAAD